MLNASEVMIKEIKESKIEGTVEDGAVIKGIAVIGKGTVVKSGSYIEYLLLSEKIARLVQTAISAAQHQ